MQIKVMLSGQVRTAAGFGSTLLEIPDGADIVAAVRSLAAAGPAALARILLTETDAVQPTLLRFLNDTMIPAGESRGLQDGDELTIMTPISGG